MVSSMNTMIDIRNTTVALLNSGTVPRRETFWDLSGNCLEVELILRARDSPFSPYGVLLIS